MEKEKIGNCFVQNNSLGGSNNNNESFNKTRVMSVAKQSYHEFHKAKVAGTNSVFNVLQIQNSLNLTEEEASRMNSILVMLVMLGVTLDALSPPPPDLVTNDEYQLCRSLITTVNDFEEQFLKLSNFEFLEEEKTKFQQAFEIISQLEIAIITFLFSRLKNLKEEYRIEILKMVAQLFVPKKTQKQEVN